MTDQKTSVKDETEETEGAEAPTLTEQMLEDFQTSLDGDRMSAYRRWGFAMFHSIAPEKAHAELGSLGLKPRDALDHYNLGCSLATREQFAQAAKAFEQALKLDENLVEARFNLALAREKSGEASAAKKLWNEYLESCTDEQETAEIKNHLSELAGR